MKETIAIVFGGRSVEHEISIRSASNICENLDPSYLKLLIGITKAGDWYLCPEVTKNIDNGIPLSLKLSTSEVGFYEKGNQDLLKIDIVFPVLHGTDGEDGSIQGLFKAMNLPVVGSDVLGSAVCMDKILSKKILENSDIPTVPYLTFDQSDKEISFEGITEKVGLPFMIKAGNLGSSVGVSRVDSKDGFHEALKDSFNYANQILVEGYVKGQEVECAVVGNGDSIESTWPGEIVLSKAYDFYSYEAKYQNEDAIKMVIPAQLSQSIQLEIRKHSEAAFKALRCNDYARVDLFVAEDGQVYVNEINTIPGFTSASMFPVLWKNMGLNYTDLLNKLIGLSKERWVSYNKLERSYLHA